MITWIDSKRIKKGDVMGTKLNRFIQNIKKHRNVIVYGAGNNAAPLINYLDENAIIDKDRLHIAVTKPKNGEKFKDYIVECIDDLRMLNKQSLVIIAVYGDYYAEIEKKLDSLGFYNVERLEDWFIHEAYYEQIQDENISPQKILFENFHGLGYGDSPKYVCEELLKNRNDLDLVWVVKPGVYSNVPEGVRTVEIYTEEFYRELYTAHIWISNVRKYQSVLKRNGQFYIQTWHGFALKRIEADAEIISNGISAPYFDAGKKDSKMIDVIISNAQAMTQIYKTGFWYDGDVKEYGTPRNDVLFRDNTALKNVLKAKYGIQQEDKIVMYAPTFRSSYKINPLDVDISLMLESLERKTKCNWVCALRLHPNIANKKNDFSYGEKIISVTDYPDIMELLAVTDALVTDYSSIMFDFMITKKPVFLYAKDLDYYRNSDRGFYFDYEKLPFPISLTNEKLAENIMAYSEKEYFSRLEQFMEENGFCDDGFASKRVAEIIYKELEK